MPTHFVAKIEIEPILTSCLWSPQLSRRGCAYDDSENEVVVVPLLHCSWCAVRFTDQRDNRKVTFIAGGYVTMDTVNMRKSCAAVLCILHMYSVNWSIRHVEVL